MENTTTPKYTFKDRMFDAGLDVVIHNRGLLQKSTFLRRTVINAGKKVSMNIKPANTLAPIMPPGVKEDQAEFGDAFVHTFEKALERGLSENTMKCLAHNLLHGALVSGNSKLARDTFIEQFHEKPPSTLIIHPGKTCNLRCTGCYSNSGPAAERLTFETFDRIITEAETKWGIRFAVISGGEPLAYKSDGKDLLDLFEKHPNTFFMFYTNGTLINEQIADRLALLGNATPAISIEGWRERTDERRGAGIFDKILAAFDLLRKKGVIFGISLTATRYNAEEIFSDEFLDFLFDEQKAYYGWIFQYMPIGRKFTLDLMPTKEQRLWMLKRSWDVIKERKIFLADFWNHASLSNGCIAGGGVNGGYLSIDWNGAVSPCVFVPYSPVNINEIYQNGGTLNDAFVNPFFKDIRTWQGEYMQNKGNWLSPCINRDHHAVLTQLIAKHEPDPIDENAQQALMDPDYNKGLEEYGASYEELSEPIWKERYLKQK